MSVVKLNSLELETLKRKGELYLIRKLRRVGKVTIYSNGDKVGIGQLELVGNIIHENGGWIVQMNENGKTVELKEFTNLSGYSSFEEWIRTVRRVVGSVNRTKLYKLVATMLF